MSVFHAKGEDSDQLRNRYVSPIAREVSRPQGSSAGLSAIRKENFTIARSRRRWITWGTKDDKGVELGRRLDFRGTCTTCGVGLAAFFFGIALRMPRDVMLVGGEDPGREQSQHHGQSDGPVCTLALSRKETAAKAIPQWLKPCIAGKFAARLKPCPSYRVFSVRWRQDRGISADRQRGNFGQIPRIAFRRQDSEEWFANPLDLFIVRGRLGALLLITRSICSLWGLRTRRRNTDRKAWYQFC
jgi:hypothetical protein